MALAEDASSPAAVQSTTNVATTASFSPPAGALVVAVCAVGNSTGTATLQTGAMSWATGGNGTWTLAKRINTTGEVSVEIWYCQLTTAPGASTARLTGTVTTGKGTLLSVRVVTGAASGAAAIGQTASASATSFQIAITPSGTGSFVYCATGQNASAAALVANGTSTLLSSFSDATNGERYGSFRLTATTTAGTGVTVGSSTTGVATSQTAAVEILVASGVAATASGAITLTAGATWSTQAAAAITLTAGASTAAPTTALASLSLAAGAATAAAVATATAAISLTAAAAVTSSAAALLTLSGAGAARAPGTATASIALSASGGAVIAATASITLGAAASWQARAAATLSLAPAFVYQWRNLLTNPSFEEQANPSSGGDAYGGYFGVALTFDDTDSHSGNVSLKTVTTTASNAQGPMVFPPWPASLLPPGTLIYQSFWFKGDVGASFGASGRAANHDESYGGEGFGYVTWTATGAWQQIFVSPWTYTGDPVSFLPCLQVGDFPSFVSGLTMRIDDVVIGYLPGETANATTTASLTLGAAAAPSATAAGALTLSAGASASAPATTAAALSLTATAVPSTKATGALTLTGGAAARAAATAAAQLTLVGLATNGVTATASITLSAGGTAGAYIGPAGMLQPGQHLIIPAYQYPTLGIWPTLAAIGPGVTPGYVIADISGTGPGTVVNPDYTAAIAAAQAAGWTVIGYVDTNYTARTQAVVEAEIDNWHSLYGLTSIFFDRADNTAPNVGYYTSLTGYARTTYGAAFVCLNMGTAPDASYLSPTVCDAIITFEGDYPTFVSTPPLNYSGHGISTGHIVKLTPPAQAAAQVLASALLGANLIYATDDTSGLFLTLPTYFAAENQLALGSTSGSLTLTAGATARASASATAALTLTGNAAPTFKAAATLTLSASGSGIGVVGVLNFEGFEAGFLPGDITFYNGSPTVVNDYVSTASLYSLKGTGSGDGWQFTGARFQVVGDFDITYDVNIGPDGTTTRDIANMGFWLQGAGSAGVTGFMFRLQTSGVVTDGGFFVHLGGNTSRGLTIPSVPPATWYRVRLKAVGTVVTATVIKISDGSLYASRSYDFAADINGTTLQTAGTFGQVNDGAGTSIGHRWDNISLANLTPSTTGSLTLGASAAPSFTAAASLTLGASAAPTSSAAASITLGASSAAQAPAAAAAQLTLTGLAQSGVGAAASLTLSAAGAARAPASAAAALTLTAAATWGVAATAQLSLTATAAARAPATAAATLSLTAAATWTTAATGQLTLTAAAAARAPATATAVLSLTGTAHWAVSAAAVMTFGPAVVTQWVNVLADGGYELPAVTADEAGYWDGQLFKDATLAHSGNQSLRVHSPDALQLNGCIHWAPAGVLAPAGAMINTRFWMWAPIGLQVIVGGRSAITGGGGNEGQGGFIVTGTGVWQQVILGAWTENANTFQPAFEARLVTAQSGVDFWIDDAELGWVPGETANVTASASLTLTANAQPSSKATGQLSLTASAAAGGRATATAAITLGAAATPSTKATAQLTLTGGASAAVRATASAQLTLAATARPSFLAAAHIELTGTARGNVPANRVSIVVHHIVGPVTVHTQRVRDSMAIHHRPGPLLVHYRQATGPVVHSRNPGPVVRHQRQ